MIKKITLILLFCILIPAVAHCWWGRCIKIIDGDTVTVLTPDMQKIRIRLYGIDAPEKRQDYGARAKQALSELVGNKMVEVVAYDQDRYGRVVALIFPERSMISANESLIASGFAWVYPRYCAEPFCKIWANIEAKCKQEGVGLWNQNATAPWEWRRNQKRASHE